jgi:hypothetical protein
MDLRDGTKLLLLLELLTNKPFVSYSFSLYFDEK